MVWTGYFDGIDGEIFLYDGTTVTQLTDNDYGDDSPQINDSGEVVWQGTNLDAGDGSGVGGGGGGDLNLGGSE